MTQQIFYKLEIIETSKPSPRSTDDFDTFNIISEKFEKLKEVKELLSDRYGTDKPTNNKIYIDNKKGEAQVVGFIRTFWNKDMSHNSKSWWQEDWVSIQKVFQETDNVLL